MPSIDSWQLCAAQPFSSLLAASKEPCLSRTAQNQGPISPMSITLKAKVGLLSGSQPRKDRRLGKQPFSSPRAGSLSSPCRCRLCPRRPRAIDVKYMNGFGISDAKVVLYALEAPCHTSGRFVFIRRALILNCSHLAETRKDNLASKAIALSV